MIVLACISAVLLSVFCIAVIIIAILVSVSGIMCFTLIRQKTKKQKILDEKQLEDIVADEEKDDDKKRKKKSEWGFDDLYNLKLVLRNLKLEKYFDVLKDKDLFTETLSSLSEEEKELSEIQDLFEDENDDRSKFNRFLKELNEEVDVDEDEEMSKEEKREIVLKISEEFAKKENHGKDENTDVSSIEKEVRSETVLSILNSMSGDESTDDELSEDEPGSLICAIPVINDFDQSLIVKRGKMISSGSYGTIETAYLDLGDKEMTLVAVKCISLRGRIVTENDVRCEVEIMKSLKHPNLLNCFGCYKEGNVMYIIMEFIKSGDLFSLKNELQLDKKIEYLRQIVDGMIYLHSKNLVHRDLKIKGKKSRFD